MKIFIFFIFLSIFVSCEENSGSELINKCQNTVCNESEECNSSSGVCESIETTGIVILNNQNYYIDTINGDDSSGDGSELKPFKSITGIVKLLKSGDTVILSNNGYFGDLAIGMTGDPEKSWTQRPIEVLFENWVTFKAAAGKKPHINKIQIGTLRPIEGDSDIPFTQVGNGDTRVIIDGITVDDGISIKGSRYVTIKNCKVTLKGTLTDNMERSGIQVFNGQYVTLDNNEITHAVYGIQTFTTDIIIKNNNIHHNIHDGISCLGGENYLIEGNKIHDIDDGADDSETDTKPWNMHVDGIHFRLVSGHKWPTGHKNFIIRNNLFYQIESMGIMINANNIGGKYENFVFENNIFGPTGGLLFHLGAEFRDGFTFRHNTVLKITDNKWISPMGREMLSDKYTFNHWPIDNFVLNYSIYNNIFAFTGATVHNTYQLGNNIYIGSEDKQLENGEFMVSESPYEEISGNINDYISSGKILGKQKVNSKAKDKGINNNDFPLVEKDYFNELRDNFPDIGAIESK